MSQILAGFCQRTIYSLRQVGRDRICYQSSLCGFGYSWLFTEHQHEVTVLSSQIFLGFCLNWLMAAVLHYRRSLNDDSVVNIGDQKLGSLHSSP